ncbi:hypothetical protein SB766_22475, partial [Pseudomonas sp. SIMBA_077]
VLVIYTARQISADPVWEQACPNTVGASLLAKNVNDNAFFLDERGACEFFASKLAPTNEPCRERQ